VQQLPAGGLGITSIGRSMAHYCVLFKTMVAFEDINPWSTMEDLLKVLSSAEEFTDHSARRNEKKELKELGKSCRFPVLKFSDRKDKVFCLIQCLLAGVSPVDWSMKSEMSQLSSKGSRVIRCMVQFLLEKKWFSPLCSALKILQALAAEMWEDSLAVLKQIPGIGEKMSSSFVEAGVTSFDKALEMGPRQLEKVLNRNPPFGDSIVEWIRSVPQYQIQLDAPENGHMNLKIAISNDWSPGSRADSFRRRSSVIVGTEQELLYYFEFNTPRESSMSQLVHSARVKASSVSASPVSVRIIQHNAGTPYARIRSYCRSDLSCRCSWF
jgi:hypothetical protein